MFVTNIIKKNHKNMRHTNIRKPKGLANIGLSCYANSVTQCLKSCISDTNYTFNIDHSLITGDTEDAREYYMKYIEKVPKHIKSQFNIKYKDGSTSTFAILSNKLANGVGKIDKYNNFIVVYICPDESTLVPVKRRISNVSSLKIYESGTTSTNIKILDEFKLVAGICLSGGHYYSIVRRGSNHIDTHLYTNNALETKESNKPLSTWYLCNDQHVTELTAHDLNKEYPFYMLFYSKVERI